jgi:hypothetical protein
MTNVDTMARDRLTDDASVLILDGNAEKPRQIA